MTIISANEVIVVSCQISTNVNWTMVIVEKCVITLLEVLRVSAEQASPCNLTGSPVEVKRMRNKSRMLPLNTNACSTSSSVAIIN